MNADPRIRWNEICSTCQQKCKNTGSTWIDGSRICGGCKRLRMDDVNELQAARAAMKLAPFTTDELLQFLRQREYKIYYVVEKKRRSNVTRNTLPDTPISTPAPSYAWA